MTRRSRRLAGVLLVLTVGVAACGGGGDSNSSDDATTTRGTDATSTSTTEDTTSVTVGIICTTAEDAATTLVDAWTADDRAGASRCANEQVVDQMFEVSGAGNTWMNQGCDRTDPGVPVCAYSYDGGAALLTVEGTEADGWKVTRLEFVAD